MTRRNMLMVATLGVALGSGLAGAQDAAPEPDNPLESFSRVIGGAWSNDGSAATFEWGFGHRSVIARSYAVAEDGSRKLVGQGFFYWDPEAETIKSVSVAEGMPFDVFEMTSRFEGNVLINELRTIAADGTIGSYLETWEFTDSDTYVWTLHEGGLDGSVLMTDTYRRR